MLTNKNQENIETLSNKLKLIVLSLDYIIFSLLFLTIEEIVYSKLNFDRAFPWLFRLLIYFVFFTLSELIFNRTLGMRLFKVSLANKRIGKSSKAFIKYSVLVIFDRFILIFLFYFFRVFFQSKKNLLLSEKYSGLRWTRK